MKGKPIEPGCLAIVLPRKGKTPNSGRVVRVLHLETPGYFPPEIRGMPMAAGYDRTVRRWVVAPVDNRPLYAAVVGEVSGRVRRWVPVSERQFRERVLIRIDDNDPQLDVHTTDTLEHA